VEIAHWVCYNFRTYFLPTCLFVCFTTNKVFTIKTNWRDGTQKDETSNIKKNYETDIIMYNGCQKKQKMAKMNIFQINSNGWCTRVHQIGLSIFAYSFLNSKLKPGSKDRKVIVCLLILKTNVVCCSSWKRQLSEPPKE